MFRLAHAGNGPRLKESFGVIILSYLAGVAGVPRDFMLVCKNIEAFMNRPVVFKVENR